TTNNKIMAKKKESKEVIKELVPREVLPVVVETLGALAEPAYSNAQKEYDVTQHDVFNESDNKRPRRKRRVAVKDSNGVQLTKEDPKTKNIVPVTKLERIQVNRIGVPLQKLIVKRRVAFMNVGKIQLEANVTTPDEQRLYDMVKKIREDNKIEFIEKEVARRLLSELQVAKLWYSEPVNKNEYWGGLLKNGGNIRLRCKILSPELGDKLLPVFDDFGNMLYFVRQYKSKRSLSEVISSPQDLITGFPTNEDERFDVDSS